MTIYASFDHDGRIFAFWDDLLFPDIDEQRNPAIAANAVVVSPADRDSIVESPDTYRWDGTKIIPYTPPVVDIPYQIAKTTPWLRMTPDEAAIMDAVMSETDARTKQIYMAATYLSSADALWETLVQIITTAFGDVRAKQLLAPET